MNRILFFLIIILFTGSCKNHNSASKRVVIARAGDAVLYVDQIPRIILSGTSQSDSVAIIQNYVNKWAKKELVFQKAEDNLSPELKDEIDKQLEETRSNLVIYQYQRQMLLEKMDTSVTDTEMENYFFANQNSFMLSSNIVKALFIKLPVETPNIVRIKTLARSNDQDDLQQLETICFQFADKFDDFGEKWVPLDRISVELPDEIDNEENFLRRTVFYESSDSTFLYLVTIRDRRFRSTLAPFDYIKDDIKRIIWNSRRFEFIQSLENGIYNDALKENKFMIFNN